MPIRMRIFSELNEPAGLIVSGALFTSGEKMTPYSVHDCLVALFPMPIRARPIGCFSPPTRDLALRQIAH